MFCNHCGKEQDNKNKFCVSCGKGVASAAFITSSEKQGSKSDRFPWFAYCFVVFCIFLITLAGYKFMESRNADENVESSEDLSTDVAPTIISELGPYMQPVGYFDDMSLYESEALSDEEWFSHVHYNEVGTEDEAEPNESFVGKNAIYSSVVKIVCEDGDYFYTGSGTNVDAAGYVLTNLHVVEGLPPDACMVGFPDPESGLIVEAYWSTIITDEDDETGHDLAYLALGDPVFDEEGNMYGYYDRISYGLFPYFSHTEECLATAPQLGDKIFVLGYPFLSGGALTVTDGLISSLYSQDGYIITSAKISGGNSGGLAINEQGCYVGVPTSFYYDLEEASSDILGEIIDAKFVFEFDDAIENDLQAYYLENGIEPAEAE